MGLSVPPAPAEPRVTISRRGEARIRGGHCWIYRSDVADVQAGAGETVLVVDARGRPIGRALYSDRSEIALRLLTWGDGPADESLWRSRLETAIAYRNRLGIESTAYRLVYGEADLLPSLIVDRYGDWLVLQALSQGADRLMPVIADALVALLRPAGILARNDSRVRLLEGLERRVEVLYGSVPDRIAVTENGVGYDVDPWKGQKTGLFLDQRENRAAAARYAHGRLLDCFSYTGGFALTLAPSCTRALAIEISEAAAESLRQHAVRNRIPHLEVRVGNAFDELRALERAGARFETIVLDPPAFAKNKAALSSAGAGYKEINLRALKLLSPGGFLVTCSCSYHVDEATFGELVYEAALDARARVVVVEKRMQSRDHPVLLGVPETYYLKCFILRKM
jgi:23S rRNA (cytosine1962-C5)-methyltransferase